MNPIARILEVLSGVYSGAAALKESFGGDPEGLVAGCYHECPGDDEAGWAPRLRTPVSRVSRPP